MFDESISPLLVCGHRLLLDALTMTTRPVCFSWKARVHGKLLACIRSSPVSCRRNATIREPTLAHVSYIRIPACVRRVREARGVPMHITREPEHDSHVAIVFVKVVLPVVHATSDVGILRVAGE